MATSTVRKGQTARDRMTNKSSRNKANVSARADWQNGNGLPTGQKTHNDNFPKDTCNGKKNRKETRHA